MTGKMLFDAVGGVREDYVLDADEAVIARAARGRRIGRLILRIGRAAACLLLVCAACFGGLDWYFDLTGAHEQVLRIKPAVIGDRMVFYAMQRLGDGQTMTLQYRRGEQVWQNGELTVWQLKGRSDYAELIFEQNGTLELAEFHSYSILPHAGEIFVPDETWPYWEMLSPEAWGTIDFSPYTFADVLRDIYRAESAADLESVSFAKTGDNNTEVGRSIRIRTVTLRDTDALALMWEILSGLTTIPSGEVREEILIKRPDDVLAEQVRRRVTVTFRSGAVLEFRYNPAGGSDGGTFTQLGADYSALTTAQNRALVELIGISFAPTPIPETKPPQGCDETETVRPIPETAVPPVPVA